ncbi:hypothetical protein [Lutispora thermophila]|uniref:hypothetical protein n=1 Tax=Lutispora thermophila TaxID=288966 RepID=UPI001587F78A|nr:hypothetical protein [Lutispora thermophila]
MKLQTQRVAMENQLLSFMIYQSINVNEYIKLDKEVGSVEIIDGIKYYKNC